MRLRFELLFALVLVIPFAAADEIVFDGPVSRTVRCEIYKETPTHIHYIDPAKDKCLVVSRKRVKRIVREEKPVVDFEAFLKRHQGKLSAQQRKDIRAAIKAAASPRTKAGKKPPPPARSKRPGKLHLRSMKRGVKVLGDPKSDTPELMVDPFAEENDAGNNAPPSKQPPAGKKQPPSKLKAPKPSEAAGEEKP